MSSVVFTLITSHLKLLDKQTEAKRIEGKKSRLSEKPLG